MSRKFIVEMQVKQTLIIVRRALAEPKAAWAGGMPQASFAMSTTWMTASSDERTRSRLFGGWGVEAIVENRGVGEESAGAQAVKGWWNTNIGERLFASCRPQP